MTARTVKLACGCEAPWGEWGGPGAEDAPYQGHYAHCRTHGETEVSEYDIATVVRNKIGITRDELNALCGALNGIDATDLVRKIAARFALDLDGYNLWQALENAGVLAPEQAAWCME